MTAYEEYRGLIIDGKHTRQTGLLDPMKKDVVVENNLDAIGRAGLALFERAAGIHAVELRPTELPENRLVNVNRGEVSGGEQYGLRLKGGKVDDGVGENQPAEVYPKTPKLSKLIVIDTDQMIEKYAEQAKVARQGGETMPYTQAESLSNTIAHEVGHGVGAPHHGTKTEWFGVRQVTTKMRDWRVVGSNGKLVIPTEAEPVLLQDEIGRPGNDASGDTNCIMCYTNYYAWAAIGPEGGPYRFIKTAIEPQGKIFCRSPNAAGYNAPHTIRDGVQVKGFFGSTTSLKEGMMAGNCLGQMNVRDW